jgi:F420-dependent oxidoreductase-like protein
VEALSAEAGDRRQSAVCLHFPGPGTVCPLKCPSLPETDVTPYPVVTGLKFGVFVPQGWTMDLVDIESPIEKYETMSGCAREAERTGYDSIWLYDHFHTVPRPEPTAVFECWSSMAALARDTSTVRLGQMVTCNSYRPPALLAKMSSCIDVLSHGRLIVGMGAGWYEHEYRAFGYEYGEMPDRLRHLRESLQVLKTMWTEERASFHGRYYHVEGAINEPKPIQKPHPPLWIGGNGERVTLKLVAQHGDGCNIGGDLDERRRGLDVLRRHCDTAGRDYDSIVRSANLSVILGDRAEVDRVVQTRIRQTGGTEGFVREPCCGRPEQVAERVREIIELGFDYIIFDVPNASEGGAIQRVAEELIPLVR